MAWVEKRYPRLKAQRLGRETVRRMIDGLVTDLLQSSAAAVAAAGPRHIDDVRGSTTPLIGFSAPFAATQKALKQFLRAHLYTHPRVREMTDQAGRTIRLMFDAFMRDHSLLPAEHAEHARAAAVAGGDAAAARVVADYVAGMTDRFALQTRDALVGAS
jgi:dGTPase